jgi:hypothetical protein
VAKYQNIVKFWLGIASSTFKPKKRVILKPNSQKITCSYT